MTAGQRWSEPCLWSDEPPVTEDSCFDVDPEPELEPDIKDVIVIGGLL
ncbi:hypothetical protein [Streptomyces syringium]